jgi:hypothetical protein
LAWFCFFLFGWIVLKIALLSVSVNWFVFLSLNLAYALLFLALWELANIVKFRAEQTLSLGGAIVFLLGRSVYLAIILAGYSLFILPGIYIHSRLLLHSPLAARDPRTRSFDAIGESWRLTSGKGVTLYALWIVTVLSKPACALPIGLGFVLERPLSGFAKDILLTQLQAQGDEQAIASSSNP